MKFKVNEITEHDDGSSTFNVDMDLEMEEFLINVAFIEILERALSDFKERFNDDSIQTAIKET
jgi:hypothetical protein